MAAANRAAEEPEVVTITVPEPDPSVEPTPPPLVAPDAAAIDPAWCTPEQAWVTSVGGDAAKGHRMMTLRATNVSDVACELNGYPDIAFSDQNGSELVVDLLQGGSFMTDDAGAAPITLQPGEDAFAALGWNAMAPAGSNVAVTLYLALYPGASRSVEPVTVDIVEGGEVAVTAWEPSEF